MPDASPTTILWTTHSHDPPPALHDRCRARARRPRATSGSGPIHRHRLRPHGRQPHPRGHRATAPRTPGWACWWTGSAIVSSGSASLEAAIDWILGEMKKDGLRERAGRAGEVPTGCVAQESAELVKPRRVRLAMLGLGGSVGTPAAAMTAPVLVVSSFDELERRKAEAKGRIVLFDVPFTTYPETRRYRTDGPSAAARAGAVACLIRSVASDSIRSPHTGRTSYDSTVARIPAAALSVEDAMMLRRMRTGASLVVVTLRMGARRFPTPSRGTSWRRWWAGRSRTRSSCSAGTSTRGTWGRAPWTTPADRSPRGKPSTDEAARAPAPPHRPGGAMDQRGERCARAAAPTATRIPPSWTSTCWRSNPTAECSTRGIRLRGLGLGREHRRNRWHRCFSRSAPPACSASKESPEADIGPLVERGVPGIGLDVDAERYFWYHHSRGRHAGQAGSGGAGAVRRGDGGDGVRGGGPAGGASAVGSDVLHPEGARATEGPTRGEVR